MACFFGFGSLVNTQTHIYTAYTPAKVMGWKRVWVDYDFYDHVFLSVVPDEKTEIQGLMAVVPQDNWQELDTRERGYARTVLNPADWQAETSVLPNVLEVPKDVQMYVHAEGRLAGAEKPILWS